MDPPNRSSRILPSPSLHGTISSASGGPRQGSAAKSFLRTLTGYDDPLTSNLNVSPMKRSASNLGDTSRTKITSTYKNRNTTETPEQETLRVITGTVENVLQWRKLFPGLPILWEVFATILRIQQGSSRTEKLLLLRKADGGPVMQGFYFEIDFKLPDNIGPGNAVRCVGRFVGTGCRFQLFKVRRIESNGNDCDELVARLSTLSNYALSKGKPPS